VLSLGIVFLPGCTSFQEGPEPPLTGAQFEERVATLEQRLLHRLTRSDEQRHGDIQRLSGQLKDQAAMLRDRLADVEERVSHHAIRLRRMKAILKASRSPREETAEAENGPEVIKVGDPALSELLTLGRAEWVGFPTLDLVLQARIDSGAETASLSATEMQEFEREGEDWIRFRLGLSEKEHEIPEGAKPPRIEAPIVRRVRIIQASGSSSRPVVRLPLQLGPITQRVEFTLEDRTRLSYPVLLGRRFLMDLAVIDVSRKFVRKRPERSAGGEKEHTDAQ